MKKIFALILALVMLLTLLSACGKKADTSTADAYLSMAQDFLDKNDVDSAIDILNKGYAETKDTRLSEKLIEIYAQRDNTTATEPSSAETRATTAPATKPKATKAPATKPAATKTPTTKTAATKTPTAKPVTTNPPATTPLSTEPAHTHSYSSQVTAPSCTKHGYTTYTCSCGDSYVSDIKPNKDHDFSEWHTIKQPTTFETGAAERTCVNCSTKETKTLGKVIPNHSHSYTSQVIQTASCTMDGTTKFSCTCGESYTETTAKTSHNYTKDVVAPTCTESGYTKYTCSCGHNYVDSKTNAAGHKYVNNVCSVCNHISVPQGYTAIYKKEHLFNLSMDGKYILICDIDLKGDMWTPIGTENSPFTGTFDGNGHAISNFTINTSFENLGFFGYNRGVIKNLSVNNFVFEINRSRSNIGGLVGYNKGTIENCYAQGNITAKSFVSRDSAGRYGAGIVIGGLAGYNHYGNIYNSSAIVNIYAESEGGKQGTNEVSIYSEAGGLVGSNYGTIQNCTAGGSVEAKAISTATGYDGMRVSASGEAGGLVGSNVIGGKITNCYSTGSVKATSIVGGLVAENNGTVENSFSSIIVSATQGSENKISYAGGLIGKNGVGSVNNSYYYNAQILSVVNSVGSSLDIATLKSYNFQVKTLGWSSDSWEFKDGYLPALK